MEYLITQFSINKKILKNTIYVIIIKYYCTLLLHIVLLHIIVVYC